MGLDIPFPIGLLVSGIGFGWAFDSFSDRDLPPFACLNVNLRGAVLLVFEAIRLILGGRPSAIRPDAGSSAGVAGRPAGKWR
jgi:hypothetical protein